MPNLQDVLDLKTRVEELMRRKDEATGALRELLIQLQNEFGCSNTEEAEGLLHKLDVRITCFKVSLDKAVAEFDEKWRGFLGTPDNI
jgi:hypothetical protein